MKRAANIAADGSFEFSVVVVVTQPATQKWLWPS